MRFKAVAKTFQRVNNFCSTGRHKSWSIPVMRRNGKSRKLNAKLTAELRRQTLQLPKHIRENIRHPLLRLAWYAELHPTT